MLETTDNVGAKVHSEIYPWHIKAPVMDVFTDPISITYRTWNRFTLPDDAGGRTAIAMSTTTATTFTALYTILIMGIFMVGWSLVISVVLLVFTPRHMTRTSYIAVVAAWNANDPFQATLVMLQHTFHILVGMWKYKGYKAEFNSRNLLLDIAILVAAAGTFAGSFTLGLLFPNLLIIGSMAPVNPDIMYYPDLDSPVNGSKLPELHKLQYTSMGALRAFGAIEGSEVTISKKISLYKSNDRPWEADGRRRERYTINYGYHITGAEMGLQKFGKLTLRVQGSCSFADDWWVSPQNGSGGKKFDQYTLWKDNDIGIQTKEAYAEINPSSPPVAFFEYFRLNSSDQDRDPQKMYYSIFPVLAGKRSATETLDPWYETTAGSKEFQRRGFAWEVATKRPPLKCHQTDEWSYGGWRGSTHALYDTDQAPVKFPDAIRFVLRTEFGTPMIVNIGRAAQASALKSSTRILAGYETGIDASSCTAQDDMKRIILAAYLSTRSIFRDVAMAGVDLGRAAPKNALRLANGEMRDGVGDVVIASSVVSSLRLGYFAAIPSILVFLFLISGIFKGSRTIFGSYNGKFYPNRYNRFLQFLTGLQATQLYRMVDQILAQVEIQDVAAEQKLPAEASLRTQHREQAHWDKQISAFPRVVYNNGIHYPQAAKDLTLPQLRAVVVADEQHQLNFRRDEVPVNKLLKGSEWKKLGGPSYVSSPVTAHGEPKAGTDNTPAGSDTDDIEKTPNIGARSVPQSVD